MEIGVFARPRCRTCHWSPRSVDFLGMQMMLNRQRGGERCELRREQRAGNGRRNRPCLNQQSALQWQPSDVLFDYRGSNRGWLSIEQPTATEAFSASDIDRHGAKHKDASILNREHHQRLLMLASPSPFTHRLKYGADIPESTSHAAAAVVEVDQQRSPRGGWW